MYISLNWLKNFVDIPENIDPKDLSDLLTLKTAEIEGYTEEAKSLENIVVGQIIELQKHPDADKLKIAKTSVGKETLQIVCGGTNLKEDMYVAVAKIGARVHWHGEKDLVTMEKIKIRGIESAGMICAGTEIDIDHPNAGEREILDLSALKPKPGTPLAELFQKNDTIFEVDNKAITHRPDLWGHYGFAREIAAITGKKLKPLNPKVVIPIKGESVKIEIRDHKLCPRYCGLIINNIKVMDSPAWLKNRLKAIGHGDHNNIVDITNYVMAELGQPMHAFDKKNIKTGIIVRRAEKNEKITTLDDKVRTLNENVLIIADHEKPLAIAGVMGGKNSGINEKTTSIILESANFNANSIRKTSTHFMLRTDTVQRFEKALDPILAETAIKRAAELILQICPGAKIAGPQTDIYTNKQKPVILILDTEKAASKIGIKISQSEIKKILETLEFKVKIKDKKTLSVDIPSFRATKDVDIEDDLIEEIARIYSYDNIPATLPELPTKLPMENQERFKKHRIRELLSYGLNFDEVYNYSFYGKSEMKNCLMSEEGHVKLLNYLSEDQTHLRMCMTPNLIKAIQLNTKYFDEFRLYEIGRTYKEIGQYYPLEEKKLAGAIVKKGKTDNPFYEAKGVAETIFARLGINSFKTANEITGAPYAHPIKALTFLDTHGQTLAKVFLLHPTVAQNHDLEKYSIAIFAINFTELMKTKAQEKFYKKIPKFPGIEIDISVILDETTEIANIEKAIKEADKELISNVKLFDIYRGEGIEKNKKATAFKINLQASNRTLADTEMTAIQNKIFSNLERLGGKIRGK